MNKEEAKDIDGKDNQIDSNGMPAEREATKRLDAEMERMC